MMVTMDILWVLFSPLSHKVSTYYSPSRKPFLRNNSHEDLALPYNPRAADIYLNLNRIKDIETSFNLCFVCKPLALFLRFSLLFLVLEKIKQTQCGFHLFLNLWWHRILKLELPSQFLF